MGYSAGSSDCIMSFNRWQKLIAARIEKVVRAALWAGLRAAVASLKKGSFRTASNYGDRGVGILSPEGRGVARNGGGRPLRTPPKDALHTRPPRGSRTAVRIAAR